MTNKMIITRGIPASGKSTWAASWVAEDAQNRMEINRDSIRAIMGFPAVGNASQEQAVTNVQREMIAAAMSNNKDMVISDTNLREKYIKNFISIAMDNNYEVEVKDFVISFDEAVARDKNREDSVGEDVIRTMYTKFPHKRWKSGADMVQEVVAKRKKAKHTPYINDQNNPQAVLVDIDGTIAINDGHRSYYDYSEAVMGDKTNDAVIHAVRCAHAAGVKIIIMSGREDVCKEHSIKWMENHSIPFDEVHFRKTGDKRPDWIVKDEMVREHIENRYNIMYCYDDRDQVVQHHRDMGYTVFQVAPGDF